MMSVPNTWDVAADPQKLTVQPRPLVGHKSTVCTRQSKDLQQGLPGLR